MQKASHAVADFFMDFGDMRPHQCVSREARLLRFLCFPEAAMSGCSRAARHYHGLNPAMGGSLRPRSDCRSDVRRRMKASADLPRHAASGRWLSPPPRGGSLVPPTRSDGSALEYLGSSHVLRLVRIRGGDAAGAVIGCVVVRDGTSHGAGSCSTSLLGAARTRMRTTSHDGERQRCSSFTARPCCSR